MKNKKKKRQKTVEKNGKDKKQELIKLLKKWKGIGDFKWRY